MLRALLRELPRRPVRALLQPLEAGQPPGLVVALQVLAVAPVPVNVLLRDPGPTIAELADLGVRRASTGGALAFTAWRAFVEAAKALQ